MQEGVGEIGGKECRHETAEDEVEHLGGSLGSRRPAGVGGHQPKQAKSKRQEDDVEHVTVLCFRDGAPPSPRKARHRRIKDRLEIAAGDIKAA